MTPDATPHVFEPAYYARLADIERRHWWALGLRAATTRLLDATPFKSRHVDTLDAGCGTGLTLDWVGRYSDVPPVGLDYSPHALAYCAGLGHRRLVQGTAVSLPFASGDFDLVISADVVQHLPRPGGDRAAFAEVARVLRPGGWFFLRTNSRCGQPVESTADYHRYSRDEIRRLLTEAGLEVQVATYANGLPGVLTTVRRVFSRRSKTAGDPGLRIVAQAPGSSLVATVMHKVLLVEAWWIGTLRLPLPFGHTILALARKPEGRV
jgi:SAM-dependent methyltransferase